RLRHPRDQQRLVEDPVRIPPGPDMAPAVVIVDHGGADIALVEGATDVLLRPVRYRRAVRFDTLWPPEGLPAGAALVDKAETMLEPTRPLRLASFWHELQRADKPAVRQARRQRRADEAQQQKIPH